MKKISRTITKLGILLCISLISLPLMVKSANIYLPLPQTVDETDGGIQMYLTVVGDSSGDIEGSVTSAGHEGSMEVLGYHHQISAPYTGNNQYSPFRIIKPIDKASPILMSALCNRESINSVSLSFYRKSLAGVYYEYYRIELANARLISIESHALSDGGFSETISFDYQTITWVWIDGGIEYSETIGLVV